MKKPSDFESKGRGIVGVVGSGGLPADSRSKTYSALRRRPAARLRRIMFRPVRVFMRLRKPCLRLRVLRLQRFGYAIPMG